MPDTEAASAEVPDDEPDVSDAVSKPAVANPDVSKTVDSQKVKGSNSYYYWHSDADRRRELSAEQPAPAPKHVLVKVQDNRLVVAGPAPPPSDEPWDDPPLPGGYILATAADRYTSADLFNWSKYISPPRGWPEAFTYFQPMKDFLAKRLKAQRVRLLEAPHPLEVQRIENTHGHRLVMDEPLANAMAVRRLLGWPVIAGYMLLEEGQGCGPKDPVNSALYHGEKHWWNATPRGVWICLSPRRHKKVVLVESAKVSTPEPSDDERRTMKNPAGRADEMTVDFVVDGVSLPGVRLTNKQLDGGATFLAACLEAVEKPYADAVARLARQAQPDVLLEENADDDSDSDDGGGGGGGGRRARVERSALKCVTIDGMAVQRATSTPPRQLLTRSGLHVELSFFGESAAEQAYARFLRVFNLHLVRLLEAGTLCFSRISRNSPPVVLAEWRTLAELIAQHGPLTACKELHLDGHGAGFGDAVLALFIPLLHANSFPALDVLSLQNSGLSDAGLSALLAAPLPRALVRLELHDNELSDAGLAQLSAAVTARTIRVSESLPAAGEGTSEAALEQLVQALKGKKAPK